MNNIKTMLSIIILFIPIAFIITFLITNFDSENSNRIYGVADINKYGTEYNFGYDFYEERFDALKSYDCNYENEIIVEEFCGMYMNNYLPNYSLRDEDIYYEKINEIYSGVLSEIDKLFYDVYNTNDEKIREEKVRFLNKVYDVFLNYESFDAFYNDRPINTISEGYESKLELGLGFSIFTKKPVDKGVDVFFYTKTTEEIITIDEKIFQGFKILESHNLNFETFYNLLKNNIDRYKNYTFKKLDEINNEYLDNNIESYAEIKIDNEGKASLSKVYSKDELVEGKKYALLEKEAYMYYNYDFKTLQKQRVRIKDVKYFNKADSEDKYQDMLYELSKDSNNKIVQKVKIYKGQFLIVETTINNIPLKEYYEKYY